MGQAGLAYYFWSAFSAYAANSMKTTPITYRTFKTVFVCRDISIKAILYTIHDSFVNHCLRSKVAATFSICSMFFVLAFPTLSNAMTGYRPSYVAFVSDYDQNLVKFAGFHPLAYIIHDGWRINLTTDYLVPWWNTTDRELASQFPLIP